MAKNYEKIKDVLDRKILLIKDSRHTKLYYQAVIDYHEYICSSKELTNTLQRLIAEGKIPPIYLQEIFDDFLIAQHLKFDVPLKPTLPNFYTKEIEEKYKLLKKFVEFMQCEYDASKSPNRIPFNPNAPIIKTERDEEFFYTQKLHNDIIDKIGDEQDKKKPKEYKLSFDDTASILYFAGEKIKVSKRSQSAPHDLLRTLFNDKTRIWNNDEIIDDWHYYHEDEKIPKNKVYQAGKSVNRIISEETKIKDFLVITTKNVSINKKYLKP